ncbi:MAG: hypothetical protein IIA62_04060 [Nitrospinae bacterium]|nr:hypothetical protein [Nitrospinota bacterium]
MKTLAWYRVAVETGQYRNWEFRWSQRTLYNWARKEISLDRIANQKL